VIATDHAPHTLEEKSNKYLKCPSGAPLVQHSLNVMLEYYKNDKISLEKIVEKMCHNPAILFEIEKRGFIKEGKKYKINKKQFVASNKYYASDVEEYKKMFDQIREKIDKENKKLTGKSLKSENNTQNSDTPTIY
jgi:hypothetical protein